jgi:hypothetical protein
MLRIGSATPCTAASHRIAGNLILQHFVLALPVELLAVVNSTGYFPPVLVDNNVVPGAAFNMLLRLECHCFFGGLIELLLSGLARRRRHVLLALLRCPLDRRQRLRRVPCALEPLRLVLRAGYLFQCVRGGCKLLLLCCTQALHLCGLAPLLCRKTALLFLGPQIVCSCLFILANKLIYLFLLFFVGLFSPMMFSVQSDAHSHSDRYRQRFTMPMAINRRRYTFRGHTYCVLYRRGILTTRRYGRIHVRAVAKLRGWLFWRLRIPRSFGWRTDRQQWRLVCIIFSGGGRRILPLVVGWSRRRLRSFGWV